MRAELEIVIASKIAESVFCNAGRLARSGAPFSNQPAHDEGKAHDEEKAAAEVTAGGASAGGRVLIAAAMAALVALERSAVPVRVRTCTKG